MRLKRAILTVAAALLLALLGVVIAQALGPLRTLAVGIGRGVSALVRPRLESVSEPLLIEARELLRVNTVEYVRKVVFPYDLYPEDFGWKEFVARTPSGDDREELHRRLYDLAREVGIRLERNPDRFIVFTVKAKAGYELDQLPGTGWISVEDARATVALPPARVTELSVEDQPSGGYHYPTFAVGPDQWKRISDFVVSAAREAVIEQGILSDAEEAAKGYLTQLLEQTGIREVRFTPPERSK